MRLLATKDGDTTIMVAIEALDSEFPGFDSHVEPVLRTVQIG